MFTFKLNFNNFNNFYNNLLIAKNNIISQYRLFIVNNIIYMFKIFIINLLIVEFSYMIYQNNEFIRGSGGTDILLSA